MTYRNFFKAVLDLVTLFQILGCTGKKTDNAATNGASQEVGSLAGLIQNNKSIAGVEDYLAQYQLTLAPEAINAAEQFSGVSLQGTVIQIVMKESGFVLTFDPASIKVVPNSTSEEGLTLAEGATSALSETFSRAGKVSLVVGLNDTDSLIPEILYGSDQNPTPFTTKFQVDASLLLEGTGATSLTVVGRKASSFSSDKQVLFTAKGAGQTTRCGSYSGCKPPSNSGGGLGYPYTNNGKCPVYANGTFYMEGGACVTEASTCGPYPTGTTLTCCSSGPGTTPRWSYSSCPCPDPAKPVPFKRQYFPDVCCPVGSILNEAGECACPAGQALQNGKCATCPAGKEAVNGVCQCKAPLVPGKGGNAGNCMCPAEDEILVQSPITGALECIHSPYPPKESCTERVKNKTLPPEFTKDCSYVDTNPNKGPVAWCCPNTLECGSTRETARTCGCSLPQIKQGNKCVCPGDKVFNAAAKTCACPADKPVTVGDKCYSCTGGKEFNVASQKCECPASKPILSNGVCTACPASEPIYVPSLNRCVKDTCTGGAVLNPTTFACTCPAQAPFWDGIQCTGCTFPGSHLEIEEGTGKKTCACDSDKPKLVPNYGCFPCAFSEENVNGACVCKPGFSPDTKNNTCFCELPKLLSADGKCELPPSPNITPDPGPPKNEPSPPPVPSPDPEPTKNEPPPPQGSPFPYPDPF